MKICFISPYIPKHTGGGEKYFFDAARLAAEKHQVFVAIPAAQSVGSDPDAQKPIYELIRQQYQQFIGASLEKITFIASPFFTGASFWEKMWWTRQFDALYYVTDGSLFFSLARKNILHIQIPFTTRLSSPVDRIKLLQWQVKNSNSEFTRKVVERAWQTTIKYVHHPMIDVPAEENVDMKNKEKIILNVGRFFRQLHTKRQDVLVKIFAELVKKYPGQLRGWRLILVGSIEDQSYADEVCALAQGLPIVIEHVVNRATLHNWYRRAAIYWHATGYEADETREPERMEHFGISTAEAMSYGAVPIVLGKGGQREVLGKSLEQLLWQAPAECIALTEQMIAHPAERQKYAQQARTQVAQFSEAHFKKILFEML